MNAEQIRTETTNRLLVLMTQNKDGAWQAPWTFGGAVGLPTSVQTRKPYQGGNAVTFDIASMINGYKSKYWNTFNGWKSIGVFPRSGQKSTWGFWFGSGEKEQEDGTKKHYPIARVFFVFNAEQCHGDELTDYLVPPIDPNSPALAVNYDEFDAMVARLEVNINHDGMRACYHPSSKQIEMPHRARFMNHDVYYSTLAHELIHWRDDRTDGKSDDYAFGELVAEIGSAYLLRGLGLPATATEQTEYNASVYLNSWIKKLGSDNKYIFQASARASKLVALMTKEETAAIEQEGALAVA